jgi:hypothetical protein
MEVTKGNRKKMYPDTFVREEMAQNYMAFLANSNKKGRENNIKVADSHRLSCDVLLQLMAAYSQFLSI